MSRLFVCLFLLFGLTGSTFAQTVSTLTAAFNASGGVTRAPDGSLYVADYGNHLQNGPFGDNRVYKIGLDGSITEFARGQVGASGNAVDADGNLYQSNIGNGTITKITPDGAVTTFSTGHQSPVGLAITADGQIYVANCGGGEIRQVRTDGTWLTVASSSLLRCPNGLTAGPDGTLYTCNFSDGNVLRIATDGAVSVLATLPSGNNGHLTYANDRLYVVDRGGHRVYEVSLAGEVKLLAGTGIRGKADGPALESSWSIPNGIAASITGDTLFINDAVPVTGNPLGVLNPVVVRMITGVTTASTRREPDETSTGFGLLQNYPNPFRQTTHIPYHLLQAAHVTLTVYDTLGRAVETLVDGLQAPGTHYTSFASADLSTGVYFYRLDVGDLYATRRMTVYR